mmetsp:Transcript_31812/g.69571  ORF Transcript_31812/g.69571 Transcript_31812/m.69571 type:complete len:85 (+) Transcript_31812:914-1168(+)
MGVPYQPSRLSGTGAERIPLPPAELAEPVARPARSELWGSFVGAAAGAEAAEVGEVTEAGEGDVMEVTEASSRSTDFCEAPPRS